MPKGKIIKSKEDLIERFWSYVDKTDDCWIWTAKKSKQGYGMYPTIKNHGLCDSEYAHRISYSLTFDDYNSNMKVCHKCDNPSCVNPSHLFLGTQSENMVDCSDKGRLNTATGERHNKAKLNWNKVREIRIVYSKGNVPLRKLADEYSVSIMTIHKIVTDKTWVE